MEEWARGTTRASSTGRRRHAINAHVRQHQIAVHERQDRLVAEARQARLIGEARAHATSPGMRNVVARPKAWLGAAIVARLNLRLALADHPCHLPSGETCRRAIVRISGEWTLVCKVAS